MLEADAEALLAFLPQTHTESDFLNWLPGEFQMTVDEERKFIRETHESSGDPEADALYNSYNFV